MARSRAALVLLFTLLLLPTGAPQSDSVVNASAIRGCTVPTAENFQAEAFVDDGSCQCADREHPDGAGCEPVPVVVPSRPDTPLCPAERPLPCMRCDDASKTCIFQCEEASGATCSKLRLEAAAFERSVHTTKELYLATVVVVAILVTASVLIDGSSWRWLQESMAFIAIGVGIAIVVHLWTQFDTSQTSGSQAYFKEHIEFDGSVFFFVLLPPIILDSGYDMKKSQFFKNIDSILLFAVVGTSFNTAIVGTILHQSGQYLGLGIFSNVWEAMQFGALISATDPVASLSVLSSAKGRLKDRTLTSLIFGEAVLNDAIAIVLYTVFARLAEDDSIRGGAELAAGLSLAGKVTFGSLGIGLAVGALFSVLTKQGKLRHFADEPHIEVSQMFLAAYGSYLAADYFELSGIISLFACACMLSHYAKYNLVEESRLIVKATIHTVAFLSEAIVFAYLGVDLVLGVDWYTVNWTFVAVTLGACLLARAMHVFPISAILNWRKSRKQRKQRKRAPEREEAEDKMRIPYRSQLVLWFAGLRGPIAYALAKMWRQQSDDPAFHQIVSTTMIVVVVTTFLCGGSFAAVLQCLQMEEPCEDEEEVDASTLDDTRRDSSWISRSPRRSSPTFANPGRDSDDHGVGLYNVSPARSFGRGSGSSPRGRVNYELSPHAVLTRQDSNLDDFSVEFNESGVEMDATMRRYLKSDFVSRWKRFDEKYIKKHLGGRQRSQRGRGSSGYADSSMQSAPGSASSSLGDIELSRNVTRGDRSTLTAQQTTPQQPKYNPSPAAGRDVPRDSEAVAPEDLRLEPQSQDGTPLLSEREG